MYTYNAVNNAVGIRMLAVVACAQKVVDTPSNAAANKPAIIDPASSRTVRLTMTNVIAARIALSKFKANAGAAKKRVNRNPTSVYSG